MSSPKSHPVKRGRPESDVDRKTLGGRIRAARKRLGINPTEMGRRIGVSQASISRTETGSTRPDMTTLARLAQELKDDFGLPELRKYIKEGATQQVPVLAYVAGGKPIVEDIHDQFITVDRDFIRLSGDVCGLRVRGHSMVENHILNGDVLLCRRVPEPQKNQIVIVDFRGEKGATVKRWKKEGEKIYLYANRYDPRDTWQEFRDWEVGKTFEVLGLIRQFK